MRKLASAMEAEGRSQDPAPKRRFRGIGISFVRRRAGADKLGARPARPSPGRRERDRSSCSTSWELKGDVLHPSGWRPARTRTWSRRSAGGAAHENRVPRRRALPPVYSQNARASSGWTWTRAVRDDRAAHPGSRPARLSARPGVLDQQALAPGRFEVLGGRGLQTTTRASTDSPAAAVGGRDPGGAGARQLELQDGRAVGAGRWAVWYKRTG